MSSSSLDLPLQDGRICFDHNTCRFVELSPTLPIADIEGEIKHPLSVILQVTRRCNLSCVFCSETSPISDPTLSDLRQIKSNLKGVPRVYISGGEPLMRTDLLEILELFHDDFVVGLPTNAMIHSRITRELGNLIQYATVGLDGPRRVTSRVRGDYDRIMGGIRRLQDLCIPISLSCVVLTSGLAAVPYVCQIADVVGAKKLKLILPIPKGNALELPADEYLTHQQAESLFQQVTRLKEEYGWTPKITLTAWTPEVEGYSVLVYPDGNTYAWPVYDQKDKVEYLGNVKHEPIETIWRRNRQQFRVNHLRKYLGTSILIS